MNEDIRLLKDLTLGMSISGFESGIEDIIYEIGRKYFDECVRDRGGNYHLIKHAKKENYKKFLIDTHIDEVGFIVTDIHEGGFLSVSQIGGVDVAVLSGSEVTIYGKQTLYGVICSTPPHLSEGDRTVLPKMSDILIDTGYDKEYLEEIIDIGTPIKLKGEVTELLNDKICSEGLDDKICALAAINAVKLLNESSFDDELTVLFSVKEEVSSAVTTGVYGTGTDVAIILDVCNSKIPDSGKKKNIIMGGGACISISTATYPKLSKKAMECAREHSIPYSVAVEASGTGTNANDIALVGQGIPCVLISVPMRSMHTPSEVVSMKDVQCVSTLVKELLCTLSKEGGII